MDWATLNRVEEGERLRALGLVPAHGEHPTADQVRERMRAAGLAPLAGASEFHDWRTIFPSAARPVAVYQAQLEQDHHAGIYLLLDVTNAGGGSVTPRLRIASKAGATNKIVYQSQVPANANRLWVYLVYPAGIEGVTAAVTVDERVSLPLAGAMTLDLNVAAATVTFSCDVYGVAL